MDRLLREGRQVQKGITVRGRTDEKRRGRTGWEEHGRYAVKGDMHAGRQVEKGITEHGETNGLVSETCQVEGTCTRLTAV